MAVNLNGIDLSGATMGYAHKTPAASQAAASSSQDGAAQQPEVNITSTASLLANLERSLVATPAIDQDRVEALRQAISAGTYQVRPEQIASGLLQSDQDLRQLNRQEF